MRPAAFFIWFALVGIIHSVNAQNSDLAERAYYELPLGQVVPKGWLRHQLEIMRQGSTGHLDEVHPKLANSNGWLGGTGDGWEETPYWLDGAVPLAYLLNDPGLKEKVLKYINWTLNHQRPSGYFGPITKREREASIEVTPETCDAGEDWWPKMIMLKVLKQYFEATGDRRVIPFMTRFFKYQYASLDKCKLGKWSEWAASRGTDNAMMAQWLFRITKDNFLLDLAAKIESQSFAWSTMLGNRDWVMNAAAYQGNKDWMTRHAVNVGMALKAPVINYERTHDEKFLRSIKTGWNDLMLLHGLPMGIFSGDEDLHGNDPTQGIELCSIVESMFSLENIIAVTGDVQYMDALERMTYNALPTQTTDDFNNKQYFQIANQVEVSRGVFDFSLPFDRGMNNVFGLRSGYTCCTSNMHQGWTKFASHLWYATPDSGIAALHYAPSDVSLNVSGTDIKISEVTDYPFSETVTFNFSVKRSVSFPFHFRIPSWCKEAVVYLNGKELRREQGGRVVPIKREWKNNDKVMIRFSMAVTTSVWGRNSRSVERGPLVYALKIGEKWSEGTEPTEGKYFSIEPTDAWNYGFLQSAVADPSIAKVTSRPLSAQFVWNSANAPIEITVPAKIIPGWKAVNGVAYQPVTDREGVYKGEVDKDVRQVTLIPYGCTKLRIVAFPVVK